MQKCDAELIKNREECVLTNRGLGHKFKGRDAGHNAEIKG